MALTGCALVCLTAATAEVSAQRKPGGVTSKVRRARPAPEAGAGVEKVLEYADTLMEQGNWDEAIQTYKNAAATWPNSADAHLAVGEAYNEMSMFGNAFKPFVRAVQLDPSNAAGYYGIGHAYVNVDKPRDAVGFLKSALRLDPDFAEARYDLALAYVALGDMQAAAREYAALKPLDDYLAKELEKAHALHTITVTSAPSDAEPVRAVTRVRATPKSGAAKPAARRPEPPKPTTKPRAARRDM
jgi:cytochrome c-type biogenesis protein CcmH/NrfG